MVEVLVYLWSVKSWALTICMKNQEIPWKIQMEQFIPVEIFRKKSKRLFETLPFRFYRSETTEIFCAISLSDH